MSRNEPLNRKPPKSTEGVRRANKALIITLVTLIVLGVFLHFVFPPDLPNWAALELRGGDRVTLSAADARGLFRTMRLLGADRDPSTLRTGEAYWVTFYQGDKAVGDLAVAPGDVVMFVDVGGFSHMKKHGLGIDYAALAALYASYGGR